MSVQTDDWDGEEDEQDEDDKDETSTLDSGFDNENVLVETLQSRLNESLLSA